jgi:hypothetical protein
MPVRGGSVEVAWEAETEADATLGRRADAKPRAFQPRTHTPGVPAHY